MAHSVEAIPATWVWAAVFVASIVAVAVLAGRGARSSESFELGRGVLGFWPLFGSVFATNVGAAVLVGAVGYGFESGAFFAIVMIPQAIFTGLLLWLWAPRIHRMRLRSVPELIERRFGAAGAVVPTLLVALMLMASLAAMQIVGMGALLATLFGIDATMGMFLSAALAIGFTMWSGLPGVAWTDAWQALWIAAADALPAPRGAPGTIGIVNLLVLFGPFYLVWQTTWQRIAAARDLATARRAIGWGWVATFVIFAAALALGMMATRLLGAQTPPDQVLGALVSATLHPAAAGLMWGALFAAMATGATSFLLSGAINLVNDVLPKFAGLSRYRHSLGAARLAVLGLGLFSLILALEASAILALYFRIIALTTAALLWPVVAAMGSRDWPPSAIVASQMAGLGTALLWIAAGNPFGINEILPGLGAGGIAMPLVARVRVRRQGDRTPP